MAVERERQFVLDLGDLIKTRLEGFVNARIKIQAVEEASFQRSIVDNDLSYQEQLDFRQEQLKKENEKTYPDIRFINEIKTSVSGLNKMVRYRKFRDGYFSFLQDLVSGRKGLEDHLEYLNDIIEGTSDRDIKEELKDELLKVMDAKRTQDRQIINSQIKFNKEDRTSKSISDAIGLVKTQLTKPDIIKDEALKNSYELQLKTLEKEKTEVGVEDRMNWMIISSISKERKNPSLWKLEAFSGFRDKSGIDNPVKIGDVKYASEQEYWQTTLSDYIQGGFVNDYIEENRKEAALVWNKMGVLPNSYLQNLVANNNVIRNHTELQEFQQVIALSIQDSIVNALNFKAKDLRAKYYLDKPDLATTKEYENAMKELENLKVMFGDDYSLSPELQRMEGDLLSMKKGLSQDIRRRVADVMADPESYGESLDITWDEAFQKYGPTAGVEVSPEVYKDKTPLEAAKEEIEIGEKVGEKAKLEGEVEEKQKQVDEAKAKKELEIIEADLKKKVEEAKKRVDEARGKKELKAREAELKRQVEEAKRKVEEARAKKEAETKKPEVVKPKPEIVVPTGEAAKGKQVRIGGQLYPSQEWYDVNVAKKSKPIPKPTSVSKPAPTPAPALKPTPKTQKQVVKPTGKLYLLQYKSGGKTLLKQGTIEEMKKFQTAGTLLKAGPLTETNIKKWAK